jgi:predicted ATPase
MLNILQSTRQVLMTKNVKDVHRYISQIPALRRLRKEVHEFKSSLDYMTGELQIEALFSKKTLKSSCQI